VSRNQSRFLLSKNFKRRHYTQQQGDLLRYSSEFIQPRLLPLSRVLLGISGISIAFYGARRANLGGFFLFCLGTGALIRAITNLETIHLVALTLHPTAEIRRTIDVDAPIGKVFQFMRDPSNFSRFMSYVKNVELNRENRLTWTVVGPAGVRVQWDTYIYALLPNLVISWRSVPRSLIMHFGALSFVPLDQNKTRVDVAMAYAPPIGALGFGVIRLLGFDPRTHVDDDLQKMKSIIESEYKQSHSREKVAS
jgi:uncharacterized membrane protein